MAWKGGLIGAILRSETAGASKEFFTLQLSYRCRHRRLLKTTHNWAQLRTTAHNYAQWSFYSFINIIIFHGSRRFIFTGSLQQFYISNISYTLMISRSTGTRLVNPKPYMSCVGLPPVPYRREVKDADSVCRSNIHSGNRH